MLSVCEEEHEYLYIFETQIFRLKRSMDIGSIQSLLNTCILFYQRVIGKYLKSFDLSGKPLCDKTADFISGAERGGEGVKAM